ncbi:MAG: TonB-dependent receptor [Myxococcaceae bacterium]|nr:TonB-dependent receptor [Myxococcaceae bacterium]
MALHTSLRAWFIAGSLSTAAFAAEPGEPEPDEAGLANLLGETVGSSASQRAERAADAPGTTWSISGTDLKRYGIQSVEEALRYLGHGFFSHEADARLNNSFSARGYESSNLGSHLAVLIDGNQAGGSSRIARSTQPYLMPIELVDHIEVILGPGSVIYGNSAMLGVVNVVTRTSSSLAKSAAVMQGSLGTPGDPRAKDLSWGEAWARVAVFGGTRFELGGETFDLVWHAAVRWDRQQGRAMYNPRPSYVGDPFDDPSAAFVREDVFNRDLGGRLFTRGSWGRWTFRGWLAAFGGTGTGPVAGSGASHTFEAELGLDATYAKPVSDRGEFSIRFYASLFDTRVITDPLEPDASVCQRELGTQRCYDTISYQSLRPYIEPLFKWDWDQTGAHVTTVGAQVFMDGSFITTGWADPDGSAAKNDAPIVAPLPNAALYAQHIWHGSWGLLNVGVRGDVGLLGWAVSPRVAAGRSLWRDATLKAVFSTGFRTPSITERFLRIEGFLEPNPNIGPERVYSAELDLLQKLKLQSVQLSVFAVAWEGVISTRNIVVDGVSVQQFGNLRSVWAAGVNLGWQGSAGPFDWGLSANVAPGRVRLPAEAAMYSEAQLAEQRLTRRAVDTYGRSALGGVFMPADGVPDFYANGHVSWSAGEGMPRLSLAANVGSPRPRNGYTGNDRFLDARNVESPATEWTVDVRSAFEMPLSKRVLFRFMVTARTLGANATWPRVGNSIAPAAGGGIGFAANPNAPVSAMAEVAVGL